MITNLQIKNFGIIDEVNIELDKGFNVLTGETGAGKSLIIDALNIISGGRFSKEMIRKGEDYSFVELNLFLPNNKIAIENNIIVSREVNINGHNLCKINGRLVTVTELKEFMNEIVDIHGQNDNQKILNTQYHINYLDNFAGEKLRTLLAEYKELYKNYTEKTKQLKENFGDEKEKRRKLDLLKYEYDEIEDANLIDNEDEILKEKSLFFENAEKIAINTNQTLQSTCNAVDEINNAIKAIDKIANINDKYQEKLTELKNIYYEIEEFKRDIHELSENEFDDKERDAVEERLDLIANFKRKYGNGIKEILQYKEDVKNEIDRIENLEEINNNLKNEIKQLESRLNDISILLNKERNIVAVDLMNNINRELEDLEMKNSKFLVKIEKQESFNSNGYDKVSFYISTNLGEDFKPLEKIASGGEMSRIMLAVKTVLANTDKTPIMIFDEIDSGISGKAAKSVGEKLKIIGKTHQVICVTHQPSIAAKGDSNYYISKLVLKERTKTSIKKLNEEEVLDEIARIANGEVTEISRKHAKELRKTA